MKVVFPRYVFAGQDFTLHETHRREFNDNEEMSGLLEARAARYHPRPQVWGCSAPAPSVYTEVEPLGANEAGLACCNELAG